MSVEKNAMPSKTVLSEQLSENPMCPKQLISSAVPLFVRPVSPVRLCPKAVNQFAVPLFNYREHRSNVRQSPYQNLFNNDNVNFEGSPTYAQRTSCMYLPAAR